MPRFYRIDPIRGSPDAGPASLRAKPPFEGDDLGRGPSAGS